MAYSKLKTLARGCTLSLLAKDIKSDRKNIRIFLTNEKNAQAIVACEEHISNKVRAGQFNISQLLDCRYNPKTQMIQ
jgi:hypothetical protein